MGVGGAPGGGGVIRHQDLENFAIIFFFFALGYGVIRQQDLENFAIFFFCLYIRHQDLVIRT